jgi:plastocyanin
VASLALSSLSVGAVLGAAASASPMGPAVMAAMRAASRAASTARPVTGSTIVIHNFAFSPGSLKVRPGQKVTVTNKDSVDHTVTSITGRFNTGDVGPGKTVTFTAPTKAGRYPYRCTIHQFMTGLLVVS